MNAIEAETRDIVALALAEDVGAGDITTEAIVPEGSRALARMIQKQPGIVFGLDAVDEVFRQSGGATLRRSAPEGEWSEAIPSEIAVIEGSARILLSAERASLNLLGHLSGIATLTSRYVSEISGTRAKILDTRKTMPGMRQLEKAAVVAGGGVNYRIGLYDAFLIKENHVTMAGGITAAVERCRESNPDAPIEVECETPEEVSEGLATGAERLLLDNMDLKMMIEAVAVRDAAGSAAMLEASGGVALATVREIAETGVDFISVGALTHSAPTLDISMLIEIEA